MPYELPLLHATPPRWVELAFSHLDEFLADHAVCEQQAALSALSLVAHYPDDEELVDRMTALAIEEVAHLRKVAALMRSRGWRPSRRRQNGYVRALRDRICREREDRLKVDRLLVCALIEARSCERFTALLARARDDRELALLLEELGPAEARHWRLFHRLAARHAEPPALAGRWRDWLFFEASVMRERGTAPTVHG